MKRTSKVKRGGKGIEQIKLKAGKCKEHIRLRGRKVQRTPLVKLQESVKNPLS